VIISVKSGIQDREMINMKIGQVHFQLVFAFKDMRLAKIYNTACVFEAMCRLRWQLKSMMAKPFEPNAGLRLSQATG
jgi:hypothetical protein